MLGGGERGEKTCILLSEWYKIKIALSIVNINRAIRQQNELDEPSYLFMVYILIKLEQVALLLFLNHKLLHLPRLS